MHSVDIVFRIVLHNAVTLFSEALMALAVIGVLFATSPVGAIVAGIVLGILAWMIVRLTSRRVGR
jgi:hypothetical protein